MNKKLFQLVVSKLSLIMLTIYLMLCASISHAALFDRGGGLLYDDILNVTWLQDANYAKTSGYSSTGLMNYDQANTWADDLVYHDSVRNVDFSDWRIASNQIGTEPFHFTWWFGSPVASRPIANSELSHMYYENLGLVGYQSNNWSASDFGIFSNGTFNGENDVGLVTNLQAGEYYSYDVPQSYPYERPWTFSTGGGEHYMRSPYETYFAWAVRDGDVSAVPEPETYAMMFAGLGLIGFVARRRKQKNTT